MLNAPQFHSIEHVLKDTLPVVLSAAMFLGFAQPPANAQDATLPASAKEPAKWGAGCSAALLAGEFALTKAPEFPSGNKQKKFIERVINEVKGGYGGTMVVGDPSHPLMDKPEFVALYLRAFADPGHSLKDYDYRFERLLARVSDTMAMIEDPRLDWDVWRAWLLLENKALEANLYEDGKIQGSKVMSNLDSARDLLWTYLTHNSPAILKDQKRRAWWVTQLTRDLEAHGGRPHRRWFLLALIGAADAQRGELERAPVAEKFEEHAGDPRGKIRLRQPHPLDPFRIVADPEAPLPPFAEALWQIASPLGLALTVLGVDPTAQPPTRIQKIILREDKWALPDTPAINQESWSNEDRDEWGASYFRPVGRRAGYSNVSFPADETDGVYFFVFHKRLHVWPKAKMDTAIVQLLRPAGLIDESAEADLMKRGFKPLAVTVERDK